MSAIWDLSCVNGTRIWASVEKVKRATWSSGLRADRAMLAAWRRGTRNGPMGFQSFPLLDTQDHALAVDRRECESNGFGDAQAGGVAGGKSNDFLWAEDDRQFFRHLGSRD